MDAMRIFVFLECLPTLLAALLAPVLYFTGHVSMSGALLVVVIGLLFQLVLMLYRAIQYVQSVYLLFKDSPDVMAKLLTLLNGLFGGPKNVQKPQ